MKIDSVVIKQLSSQRGDLVTIKGIKQFCYVLLYSIGLMVYFRVKYGVFLIYFQTMLTEMIFWAVLIELILMLLLYNSAMG